MVPLSYYSSRLIEKVLLSLQSCIIAVHCVNKCYNILSSRGFAVIRGVVFAVIMAVCGFAAQAQQGIVKVDVPDTVCYGDTVEVTFGFDESYSVMFQYEEVTLGQDDKIFLPDGEPCGDMGCAYWAECQCAAFWWDSQFAMQCRDSGVGARLAAGREYKFGLLFWTADLFSRYAQRL